MPKRDKDFERFQERMYSKSKYSSLLDWPMPREMCKMSAVDLFDFAWSELGKSLLYMKFFHPPESLWGSQLDRVHAMCRELAGEGKMRRFPNSIQNRKWFREFLSRIADEIENQC